MSRSSAGEPAEPSGARRVAVVGGGLAGITAALGCADAGFEVSLYEARPRLGGLTHSFRRSVRDGDLWIDNGQHVFLRCCTSYLRLLTRLGVDHLVTVQGRLDVAVRSERDTRTARLRRTGWTAPLHLTRALAGYRWLSPAERIRLVRAALALRGVDRDDPATDAQSFGDWLGRHGQSPRAVDALWDLIGIATLNSRAGGASLALAATVFQIGLLESASAADIGWSRVPLQHLHGDAATKALAAAGATVHTGRKVRGLRRSADGWSVDEGTTEVDDVVLAVDAPTAERLAPTGAIDRPSGWSAALGQSPIVNLHVVFDRPVLDEPFVAAVDSPLQWIFDRTAQAGLRDGQYLAVSLSAADELIDVPVSTLRERFVPHLRRLLRAPADAEITEFFVTRERAATFRPSPGTAALRPASRTTAPGLHLAGAWTDTGWPATMEGAVRSGEAATAGVLQSTRTAEAQVIA